MYVIPAPAAGAGLLVTELQSHLSATIELGSVIGAGTTIWHQAHVRVGAIAGRSCNLGKNVYIDEGARVGDRVKIQSNVSVYNGVQLGDEVFAGPSVVSPYDLRPRAHRHDWELTRTIVGPGANATLPAGAGDRQVDDRADRPGLRRRTAGSRPS